MDDTPHNRVSEDATTRKRRSSILKNQRPSRTPFSELEFNVATPTDTAKSRRVSFSRRTGVAEFVTNEATNTWKTIYVEQNKSFESSGNDSVLNPRHQTVGCLGKRIFDQQFEEIEVVDYGGNIIATDNIRNQQMNMSLNFTQQIASLECGRDDRKLAVPQQNFEMSALTDHKSNLFGDVLPIIAMEDVSNRIDINFSAIQPIGLCNDKYDDLDEIQRDILTSKPKNFPGRRNISEYTEVDLNTTYIGMKNDNFDMSITDTIQSSKVQEVSKSNMSVRSDKKYNINNDWIADKENIVVNPYTAPKESLNFAINKIPDQVLVFDGRKLTVQSETNITYNNDDDENFRKLNLTNKVSSSQPQRKTFVLNVNDDLPNFVTNTPLYGLSSSGISDQNEDYINKGVLMEQNLPQKFNQYPNSHNTIIYDGGDIANISVTQAVPTNILGNTEKRKTIVFDNDTGNLSMTQVVPTNVIMARNAMQPNKTILYEEDNISFTQAVPLTNILENPIASDPNNFDVSFTQAVPNNLVISNKIIQTNKADTILFENDSNDVSFTRVLPSNILNCENQIKSPVIIESNSGNERVEGDTLSENNRLCNIGGGFGYQDITKLNDNDQFDISETRMLPTKIIETVKDALTDSADLKMNHDSLKKKENSCINMAIIESIPDKIFCTNNFANEKTKTFSDINEVCDISVTGVLPTNIITDLEKKCLIEELENIPVDNNETIVESSIKNQQLPDNIPVFSDNCKSNNDKATCDNDLQAVNVVTVSSNKTLLDKTNIVELNISVKAVNECTNVYKSHVDMSITQVVHPNDTLLNRNDASKGTTIVYDGDNNDVSVTQSIKTNILINDNKSETDSKPLLNEKGSNRENLTSISVCNCMVITSTQPCQIHICTHSNFSISKDVSENHTTFKQSEGQYDKTAAVNNEVNLPNTSLIKNSPSAPAQNEILLKSMNYLDEIVQDLETSSHKSVTDHNYQDVFVYQAVTSHNVSKHHVGRIEEDEVIAHTTIDVSKKSSTDLNRPNQSFNITLKNDALVEKKEDKKEIKKSHKKQKRNSFLSKLLNMSNESINLSSEGFDDKNIMVVIKSQNEIETVDKFQPKVNEPVEKSPEADSRSKEESIGTKSFLYQIKEIGNTNQEDSQNEKPINLNSEIISDKSMKIVEIETDSDNKLLRKAVDTNDLLNMLSDITDKTTKKQTKPDEDTSPNPKEVIDHIETDKSLDHVTTEDKTDPNDLQRAGVTKSRMSVMISREDLLNNISRVQAALEQANDIDDSEMFNCTTDTTEDEPDEIAEEVDRRSRQARVSTEVVKTLQFDDSVVDVSSKSSTNLSPLKKTALVDISSLKDVKGKVIPPYLMDVSDDIKSLMKDLVKPAADVMPFETGVDKIIDKTPKQQASTNSIEIQANLITSSQIDLDVDSDLVSERNSFGPGAVAANDKFPHPSAPTHKIDISDDAGRISNNSRKKVSRKPCLVFDQTNPLNNVILLPSGTTDVHNYRPINTASETAVNVKKATSGHSRRSSVSEMNRKTEEKVQLVCTQYNVKIDPIRSDKQLDDTDNKTSAGPSVIAASPEEIPVHNPGADDEKTNKDTDTNTVIVMKCNKDLLQTSSSLTIVDDDRPEVVVVGDETVVSEKKSKKTSPVKVIFKLDDQNDISELSELSDSDTVKAKKRMYSPAKYDHQRKVIPPGPDATPRACSKMQKLSTSPFKSHMHRASTAKLNHTSVLERVALGTERSFSGSSPLKKSPKSIMSSKPANSVTVQRMSTECNAKLGVREPQMYGDVGSEYSSSSTLKTETISHRDFTSSLATDSLMSDEAMKEARCRLSSATTTTSEGVGSLSSDPSRPDCAAGLEDQDFNVLTEIDCDADVISKIDKLPFIGTRECEWDHSEVDSWRFLLMRKSLRLTVHLKEGECRARAHAAGERRRRCAHDDTLIACTAVDHLHEEADAVSATCARLASEAMRYECVRGAARAGDVPALLRRCVGVARAARRWARAMRDARAHLAYTLADSGWLVLRVANVPLRSVYEVTMRIELVVEDAREPAWPRAGHVTLRDATDELGERGECAPDATAGGQARHAHAQDAGRESPRARAEDAPVRWMPDVRRAVTRVPHDWGHAPRTLWKVFRYLKNKTRADQLA